MFHVLTVSEDNAKSRQVKQRKKEIPYSFSPQALLFLPSWPGRFTHSPWVLSKLSENPEQARFPFEAYTSLNQTLL